MHVAQFTLYNSYIPQEFRKIVNDYYAISSKFTNFGTSSNQDSTERFEDNSNTGSRYDLRFNYLVNDDFQLAIQNDFGRITNLLGMEGMGELPTLIRTGANVTRKGDTTLNKNVQNLNNLFSYALWQKTNPLSVNMSIVLYAKTDPLIDVVIPAYAIMSHCIIDYVKENAKNPKAEFLYGFPGLTAFEATKIGKVYDKVNTSSAYETNNTSIEQFNSKLISLNIDGVVNLRLAMIKNITPVFSKHTAKSDYNSASRSLLAQFNSETDADTKKKLATQLANTQFNGDYPIYAEINLQIESLIPADSNMLWEGALAPERDKSFRNTVSSDTIKTDANQTAQYSSSKQFEQTANRGQV